MAVNDTRTKRAVRQPAAGLFKLVEIANYRRVVVGLILLAGLIAILNQAGNRVVALTVGVPPPYPLDARQCWTSVPVNVGVLRISHPTLTQV